MGALFLWVLPVALTTGCQLNWNLAVDPDGPSCRVRYVSSTADPAVADGLGWETALGHPQDGIDAAATQASRLTPCEVWVAGGTYHIHRGQRTDTLRLATYGGGYGGFAGDETQRTGGGMLNDSVSPTIRHCTFTDNEADQGGGAVANIGGAPSLVNCRFLDNAAPSGGAMVNRNAVVDVTSCIFAADGSRAPATEFDGNPRVDDPATENHGVGDPGFADMGAFEFLPSLEPDDE